MTFISINNEIFLAALKREGWQNIIGDFASANKAAAFSASSDKVNPETADASASSAFLPFAISAFATCASDDASSALIFTVAIEEALVSPGFITIEFCAP